ncbi:MAG: hypothetical protein IIA66_06960 [Planctomycetes bacterium]|nr:hypothetical protein [Planctomycetota bacterium]
MILLIATFLPILSAGGPPEPTKAEPPLEALVPGRWRGMMTADGKTTHMTIEVKEARQGFVGESLMWFGLTEDEAHNAQFGALPRQGVHKRAFVIEQDFAVTLAGDTIKFAGRRPRRLLLPLSYNPDTFAGRLERPGVVMGTARDTKTVGGFFHLWKEDALHMPLPLELAKGETHELACLDGLPFHYRCHIPQSYDPARPTPLLINSSPMGQGQPLSVKMAEEVGWLMVGLKESKNGPMPPNLENLNAVLFDLRRRFNIHPRRLYFSGFSGGSRMASWAAVNHQDACAGIICIGAGHYDGVPPKLVPIFFIVGQSDFNHDEVVALHSEAERSIRKTELIVHPGGHTWGRPQDHEAAIRWLDGLAKKRRTKGD